MDYTDIMDVSKDRIEEFNKRKTTINIKWNGNEVYPFETNPSTIVICGAEKYQKILKDILRDAGEKAATAEDLLLNLYKLQGYGEQEIEEGTRKGCAKEYLSNVIDLEITDRFYGEKRKRQGLFAETGVTGS